MGFELSVVGGAPAPGLAERWRASLAAHGLLCEFHPDFAFGAWGGGFLPIKLSVVPGSFPAAERYGAESVVCGFEFDEQPYRWDGPLPGPPELAERLRQAGHLYEFRTSMGRDVGDLRLQCLGSAALSELVSGAVYDHQQGTYSFGPTALANAMREADEYEANWAQPHRWRMTEFAGFVRTEDGGAAGRGDAAGPAPRGR